MTIFSWFTSFTQLFTGAPKPAAPAPGAAAEPAAAPVRMEQDALQLGGNRTVVAGGQDQLRVGGGAGARSGLALPGIFNMQVDADRGTVAIGGMSLDVKAGR